MKHLLIILLIFPCFLQGQYLDSTFTLSTGGGVAGGFVSWNGSVTLDKFADRVITGNATPLFFGNRSEVISTYDTTILFKGIDTCEHIHDYVSKSNNTRDWACAAIHGPEGCSDNWLNEDVICTICLRNFNVTERRIVEIIIQKDKYQEAKDKLNKINK